MTVSGRLSYAPVMAEKNVMVSARLPQPLVEAMDERRKAAGLSRTEWLTRAVTHVLADTRPTKAPAVETPVTPRTSGPLGPCRACGGCTGFVAKADGALICRCGHQIRMHQR
jgi:hypothetical protein